MPRFLFPRLTAGTPAGHALFAAASARARRPHWYVEGKVPDTIDGRFAVLATVSALILTRLEQLGDEGNMLSAAFTERFVEVMEAEHRELGLGDPGLGKTVRKLVGSLARRLTLWRAATGGEDDWAAAARESLYKGGVDSDALRHSAAALQTLWDRLERSDLAALEDGRIG